MCLALGLFADQQRMRVTRDLATSVTAENNYSNLNKTSVHFVTSKPNQTWTSLNGPEDAERDLVCSVVNYKEILRRHVPEERALHRCTNLKSRELSEQNHA